MAERDTPADLDLENAIDPNSFEWFARLGLHLEPVKNLLKKIKFPPNQTIVDLGAATGLSTEALIQVIPRDVFLSDRIILVEPSNEIRVAKKRLSGYSNVKFVQQDANQFLADDAAEVDQIHFHNAIHLLSDQEKERHFKLAFNKLKRSIGIYAGVTTFIEGGETEEEKPFYQRWVLQSLRELRARSKEIYDKVGSALRETKAEARKRLSGLEYRRLLENAGFEVICCDDNSPEAKMPITYEGFRRIVKYWLWNNGVLPGAPYDLAEEVQTIALDKVWKQFDRSPDYISMRNCALILVQKPA